MTDKYRITVILPFKNEEKYIEKCISSIQEQTYADFEVICVDDLSTDSTRQIIEVLVHNDSRFRIVNGNGKGAGAARNTGISYANGDYIIFLDADDFFERDMLETVLHAMVEKDLDICIFNCYEYDDLTQTSTLGSPVFKEIFVPANDVFAGTDTGKLFFITSGAPWNKMIKKSFFDSAGIRFMETVCFNDIYLTYTLLSRAKRISIISTPKMYYRVGNAASLQNNKWNHIEDAFFAFDKIYAGLLTNDSGKASSLAAGFRNFVLSCSFSFLYDAKTKEDFLKILHFIKANKILAQLNKDEVYDFLKDLYNELCSAKESDLSYLYLCFSRQKTYARMNMEKDQAVNEINRRYNELLKSGSYRIGSRITAVKRYFKNKFKHKRINS